MPIRLSKTFCAILEKREFLREELLLERDYSGDITSIPRLEHALDIIKRTINDKKKLAIAADYDCDGITSAAQFCQFLKSFGISAPVFFPDRYLEGYGLNQRIIESAYSFGSQLLICLDFGSSSNSLIQLANNMGIKVVVLDHHKLSGNLPESDKSSVIISSQFGRSTVQPLCTSGLTFFFLSLLADELKVNLEKCLSQELLELATVGTLCDMVPLRKINRLLVSRGLIALEQPRNLGLTTLASLEGKTSISQKEICFSIGPKLNAAGRLNDPSYSLELLTTEDSQRALELAIKLTEFNEDRKLEQKRGTEIALDISRNYDGPALAVYSKHFKLGVIGLIAQKLVEIKKLPVAIMANDGANLIKGSARVPRGFDCFLALQTCSNLLEKFGGHKYAGGFSLRNDSTAKDFEESWVRFFEGNNLKLEPEFDCVAEVDDLNLSLVDEFELLKPFGVGNPEPKLLFKDCFITNAVKRQYNTEITVSYQNKTFKASLSGYLQTQSKLERKIDIIAALKKESIHGFNHVVLQIKELV
ncbi:MAG: DHH family phosphoesterase [Deltaproteobacteria bacterium]|nr:DHH family phosphoesterase [Deltaproteobacteria bacterium]